MPRKTPDERFLEKIETSDHTGCWLWLGQTRNGYGYFFKDGAQTLAHRYAYEMFVGPIPKGLMILHRCDVRRCVNPKHLRPGTAAENHQDMLERGRRLYGVRAPTARLTAEAVKLIRSSNQPTSYFAKLFGVMPGTISAVRHGKTWRSVADGTTKGRPRGKATH